MLASQRSKEDEMEIQGGNKDASQNTVLTAELFSAYRQMLAFLFLASLGLLAVITITLLVAPHFNITLSILVFVALSGALGAFFSALARLYSLADLPAALVRPDLKLRNWHLFMYALIPPIVGAIGAIVFYVCVASGLIQGDVFQKFKCKPSDFDCNSLDGLLNYSPETVTDYAKALVWGFVSGFSERLVPDALSRLEKSGKAG
jgi:hypothetical protein